MAARGGKWKSGIFRGSRAESAARAAKGGEMAIAQFQERYYQKKGAAVSRLKNDRYGQGDGTVRSGNASKVAVTKNRFYETIPLTRRK